MFAKICYNERQKNMSEVDMKQDIQALMDFLTRSVSPYHGVNEVLRILEEERFDELPLAGDWQLSPGGKYRIDCRAPAPRA